jgi:hypothetical protein
MSILRRCLLIASLGLIVPVTNCTLITDVDRGLIKDDTTDAASGGRAGSGGSGGTAGTGGGGTGGTGGDLPDDGPVTDSASDSEIDDSSSD